MTLIAGFMKNDCPILIGDLLISNTKESSDELVIPTVGKISPHTFQNGIFRPSAFSQKVNLLSPKLALAWSGDLLEAKEFMGQLIGAGLHNTPSRESILEIYNDLSPNELSVIGLLRDGEDLILFDINAIQVNARDPSIKWFKASGTGYGRLLNINHDLHSANISGNLNKLELGISTAVRITTSLITLELETALPLQELFGAGYEILHPLGSGLAKFEDLTYYFWTVNEIEPQIWGLSLPFLAMKYSYHDDILIIRSVRLSPDKSTNLPMIYSDELQ